MLVHVGFSLFRDTFRLVSTTLLSSPPFLLTMLHNDTLTWAKLSGIIMSGAGLGLWKVAKQPQIGAAVASLGAITTLYSGFIEMEHKAEEVKHRVEQGRPPHA